jgi:transcription initiation factor TFIIIB Brf1 subunit/transcription initiation factor TFIIB
MSDAEQQPTTVSGAANTIKGLLNQSADTQPAPTETATVTEETLTQAEEPIAPSNVPDEPNALSEEYDESVESDIVETTELSEEPIFPVVIDGQKYEVNQNELINGYQRQADYSRKTEELSIERKQQEDQI